MADDRWLVVGLGNPEGEYGGTRHNLGADAVQVLAARSAATLGRTKRIRCQTADVRIDGIPVTLAIPESYMNLSGGPIQQASAWLKVPVERIAVIHDDIDLALARLRLKRGGGSGGHNGLRDIDRALGSREYVRIRLGVGRPPGRMAASDYVLRRFAPAEREQIDVTIQGAADAVELLVTKGLEAAQRQYHAPS